MRLDAQIQFLRELDQLKHVLRRAILVDESRRENTAEHCWHAAMAALTLAEYADEPVDVMRVVKMLLVHDIVEIDAGDTFAYDEAGHGDKSERENTAAERIFGLLPDEQGEELKALWQEFEAAESADAKFAKAMDQLIPFLHNTWTEGLNWKTHQPTFEQVYERNQIGVGESSSALWEHMQHWLNIALENGWLARSENRDNNPE